MAWWSRRRAAVERADRVVGGHLVGLDPRRKNQPWQDRARFHSVNNGPVRLALGLVADLAARCSLTAEYTENGRDWSPRDDDVVRAVLDRYRGENATQADLVRQHVWLYGTIGEAVQVIYDAEGLQAAVAIRDPQTVEKRGDRYLVKSSPTGRERDGTAVLVDPAQVRRLWIADPTWPDLADSELHGVLAECDRYHALGRAIMRGARSRLTVNGMIWTPGEAHQDVMLPDDERTDFARSELERDYVRMSELAYNDDDDTPATAAPLMVNWSKDYGPPVRVDLTRPWDGQLLALRQEALESIARGLRLPSQLIIEGPGAGGNRWGDWLADEHQSRIISGNLERVCGDITATHLRPTLAALSGRLAWAGDPERWRVGFDLTPITVHPDLSAMAVQLWQWGAINLEALLRETGFDEVQDVAGPPDLSRLREVFSWHHSAPFGQGGPGLPVDGSTVTKAPPANPRTNGGRVPVRATLAPFPAERATWDS